MLQLATAMAKLPPAQLNLGICYINGQGVPEDRIAAHMWLDLASSRFGASDKERRDAAVTYRDQISEQMSSAEIAEAQKLAQEWHPN